MMDGSAIETMLFPIVPMRVPINREVSIHHNLDIFSAVVAIGFFKDSYFNELLRLLWLATRQAVSRSSGKNGGRFAFFLDEASAIGAFAIVIEQVAAGKGCQTLRAGDFLISCICRLRHTVILLSLTE